MSSPRSYPLGEPNVIDLGARHFVMPMNAQRGFLWWHDCPKQKHIAWGWIGTREDGRASGHGITTTDPLTIQGSLICNDCGDHGFIEGGRWRVA